VFQNYKQARRYIDNHAIQMIDYKFCDLYGRWHHLTLPATHFTESLLEEGIGFDGSSVGLKSVKSGDMVLVPDLGTAVCRSILGDANTQLHLYHAGSGHA
jgi:glutamine synthetase